MVPFSLRTYCLCLCIWLPEMKGQTTLRPDALSMLRDPLGWQYASVETEAQGKPDLHACFDPHGQPQSRICHGNLTLTADGRFTKALFVGKAVIRSRGTYKLNGNELTMTDESNKIDGPYTVDVRPKIKLKNEPRK